MAYLKLVTASSYIHDYLWLLVHVSLVVWETWYLQASAPTYIGACLKKAVPGVCTLMTPYVLLPLM